MTTVTQSLPQPPPVPTTGFPTRAPARITGPLLILSGSGTSLGGALRVAEALARRDGVHAHVLGVARPLPPAVSRVVARAADMEVDDLHQCRRRTARARARRKLHQAVGMSAHFSTGSALGEADTTAAGAARARSAEYILTGLPPAGSRQRTSALGTARRLARAANVPVMGVAPDRELLPGRALVLVNSGEGSMRAVTAALALLAQGGTLALAATPREVADLRGFAATLGALAGVDVRTIALPSDPGGVLALAGGFDLVAVTLRDSEAEGEDAYYEDSALLARAPGCVLIVPPADSEAPATA